MGDAWCMHHAYKTMSRETMRAEAQYSGMRSVSASEWREKLKHLIALRIRPSLLRACGVTPELLAYCRFTIEDLILPQFGASPKTSRYYMEHLIEDLAFTYDDFLLLGFRFEHLADKAHFPLIVLYDKCGMRAEHLFRFFMSVDQLQNCVLHVDQRYATLLSLNLPYWFAALQQCK